LFGRAISFFCTFFQAKCSIETYDIIYIRVYKRIISLLLRIQERKFQKMFVSYTKTLYFCRKGSA